MHKNAPLIILGLVLLLGMNISGISYANDFEEGLKAYNNGDFKKAHSLFLKEAKRGSVNAQCRLGILYHNGQGVLQDYKEAVKWYRLAAEQGLARAKCLLAVMYATGKGVSKNYSEAKRWAKEGFEACEESCKEVWERYNLANH